MRVFRYVIQYDGGNAPNYAPPFVTLAVCKPRVRKAARVGDMVLGFQGRKLGGHPHGVRWAGIVGEKLRFDQYWMDSRFESKKPSYSDQSDNIYAIGPEGIFQVPNKVHGDENINTDLRGIYVLVFSRWWIYGPSAPVMPSEMNLRIQLPNRRGHRESNLCTDEAQKLISWLDTNAENVGHHPQKRVVSNEIDEIF